MRNSLRDSLCMTASTLGALVGFRDSLGVGPPRYFGGFLAGLSGGRQSRDRLGVGVAS